MAVYRFVFVGQSLKTLTYFFSDAQIPESLVHDRKRVKGFRGGRREVRESLVRDERRQLQTCCGRKGSVMFFLLCLCDAKTFEVEHGQKSWGKGLSL